MQHHFATAEQQQGAAKFGMWIFLVTEILLFGGLFCAYSIFRAWNPEMFYNAHLALNRTLGIVNTFVLISSSLTMALAIRSLQKDQIRQAALYLAVTLLFAATFLVIKYFEYEHKIHLGQLPGKFYTYTGVEGTNPHIFFSVYFIMTGLHGLHIVGGIIVIAMMLVKTLTHKFSSAYYTPVELTGLYWHLVDLIWIYLFPLLYLIG